MHALDLLTNNAQVKRTFVAVFGDDAYLRRESIEAIIRGASAGSGDDPPDVTRFAGDSASLADVLDELRTVPFFGGGRLVVVDEADTFVTAHREELEAYAEHPSPTSVLILSVKQWRSNTRLAKIVEKMGLSVECKAPSERELPGRLVSWAKTRLGATLDGESARLLLDLVGPEMGLLASELEKLAVAVGASKRIGRIDVARLVGAGRIETIWKAIEAATTGQAATALEDIDRLIASGEHPVGLLAALSASLRKVHHAGRLRMARLELQEACRTAGIPPFAVEKTRAQHAHLGPRRVDDLPDMLLRADLDLKGGSALPPRFVLEKLFVELARPR